MRSLLGLVSGAYMEEETAVSSWRDGARKLKKAINSKAKAIVGKSNDDHAEVLTPLEDFAQDDDQAGLFSYRKIK